MHYNEVVGVPFTVELGRSLPPFFVSNLISPIYPESCKVEHCGDSEIFGKQLKPLLHKGYSESCMSLDYHAEPLVTY